jgi:hypothetical protein
MKTDSATFLSASTRSDIARTPRHPTEMTVRVMAAGTINEENYYHVVVHAKDRAWRTPMPPGDVCTLRMPVQDIVVTATAGAASRQNPRFVLPARAGDYTVKLDIRENFEAFVVGINGLALGGAGVIIGTALPYFGVCAYQPGFVGTFGAIAAAGAIAAYLGAPCDKSVMTECILPKETSTTVEQMRLPELQWPVELCDARPAEKTAEGTIDV